MKNMIGIKKLIKSIDRGFTHNLQQYTSWYKEIKIRLFMSCSHCVCRTDYGMVYQIIKEAFACAKHSDGRGQDLAVRLRESCSFIPELSLVVVEDSRIVGHILFTKAFVNAVEVLALAPLSVLPEYQNKGIGLSLIKQGHMIAFRLGYGYSVVLGHSKYYTKAGYVTASRYGIKAPFDISDKNFMAINLNDEAKSIEGVIQYDEAFGID